MYVDRFAGWDVVDEEAFSDAPYELKLAEEYKRGLECGLKKGFDDGWDSVEESNCVIDGEILDGFSRLRGEISKHYRMDEDEGRYEHNRMLFDIQHAVSVLLEQWVMSEVYDYYARTRATQNPCEGCEYCDEYEDCED